MATRQDVSDAFTRQQNAMSACCDGATGTIDAHCLSLSGRQMQIANRVEDWHALPDESDSYAAVADALNRSADLLEAGDDCLEALSEARAALDLLDGLLDR